MYARECVHETSVAFICHDGYAAGFGDAYVRARYAHVSLMELRAQFASCDLHQLLDVFPVLFFTGRLLEFLSDLATREMYGGHHHVGWTFAAQLDYPFAEICLAYVKPGFFKMGVETDLFGGHGLGLDDVFDVVVGSDVRDDLAGFGCIRCAMDDYAALFRFCFELGIELLQMFRSTVFDVCYPLYCFTALDLFKDCITADAVFNGELVESFSEKGIVESVGDLFVVVACGKGRFMLHLSALQKDDMYAQWTMYADCAYTFDVGGTAWSCYQRSVGDFAVFLAFAQIVGDVCNAWHDV